MMKLILVCHFLSFEVWDGLEGIGGGINTLDVEIDDVVNNKLLMKPIPRYRRLMPIQMILFRAFRVQFLSATLAIPIKIAK